MALKAVGAILYGPSASEQLANQRADITRQREILERDVSDLEAKHTDRRTRALNANRAQRYDEGRRYCAECVELKRQQVAIQNNIRILRSTELRLQQASSADATTRTMNMAHRSLSAANVRIPIEDVRRDAEGVQRQTFVLDKKMKAIGEATDFSDMSDSDDDLAEEEEDPVDAMQNQLLADLMPAVATSRPVASPLVSSAAAAAYQGNPK